MQNKPNVKQALERRTRKERIIVRKKARKQAKQKKHNHIFELMYNRTITSDQSELKQGKDGRRKEKECKKYRKK